MKSASTRPFGRGRGTPDPVDLHVGRRMRLRRNLLGMSQEVLAKEIGVTFQQVQKYERGHNRISASRLFDIASILDVSISWFFEDIGAETIQIRETPSSLAPRDPSDDDATKAVDIDGHPANPLLRNETLELVRAYWKLSPTLQERVILLFQAVGSLRAPTTP